MYIELNCQREAGGFLYEKNQIKQKIGGEYTRKRKNKTGIPDYEIESLARALLPAIQKLFEDDEVKKEFEKWKRERQKTSINKNLR